MSRTPPLGAPSTGSSMYKTWVTTLRTWARSPSIVSGWAAPTDLRELQPADLHQAGGPSRLRYPNHDGHVERFLRQVLGARSRLGGRAPHRVIPRRCTTTTAATAAVVLPPLGSPGTAGGADDVDEKGCRVPAAPVGGSGVGRPREAGRIGSRGQRPLDQDRARQFAHADLRRWLRRWIGNHRSCRPGDGPRPRWSAAPDG